jgi:phosphoglycolate phosphatase
VGTFEQVAIFDLDGTLVDSVEQISRNLNQARSDFGFSAQPQSFYENLVGLPVSELLSDLTTSSEILSELVTHFRELLVLDIKRGNVVIFPGVIELFKLLESRRIHLAVATSKPTAIAQEVIWSSNLSQFAIHVQGTDNFLPKPDPAVILRVLAKFTGKSSFMVGDRTEDVLAAKRAGIAGVGIAASAHSEEELKNAGAKVTFKSFMDFYRAVEIDVSLVKKIPNSSLQSC